MLVLLMPTTARDQGQKELDTNFIKITSLQKGMNSLTQYSLVHKFILMPQAMKIPDAKAVVEKKCEKLKKIKAWQLTKKKVIEEARDEGRKVHFASLMDLCHHKNSELEPKYQKYTGRVVLRGDIV